jgi:predicted nucleotidyltransferase component of viral defense system
MDHDFLSENNILFAGGTLLTMTMGEYRLSDDIDFLVQVKTQGLKNLRARVTDTFAPLFRAPHDQFKFGPARKTQYGIRGSVSPIGCAPIKLEIFLEERVSELYPGEYFEDIPVLALSRKDMILQKLFANSDRYSDPYIHHRDLYDLAAMAERGIDLLTEISRAEEVYSVRLELERALRAIEDTHVLNQDLASLAIEQQAYPKIIAGINKLRASLGMGVMNSDFTDKPKCPDE